MSFLSPSALGRQTQSITKQQVKLNILQNPFHPLDLSPYDLLQIYKRFQQSRKINRNPKQEIPIQTIAQLISSLKGCKPSYIQKCMSQALIKNTISWNDFLKFLDQQSQVRQKILQWLLHQTYTFKYHLKNYYPFRSKVQKSYQFITFLKIIQLGDETALLCSIDQYKILLIDITDRSFHELDRYVKVNPKTNLQDMDLHNLNNSSKSKAIGGVKIDPSFKFLRAHKKYNQKSAFSQKLIPMGSFNYKSNDLSNIHNQTEDEQAYFKKQRKNINSVFSVFKDLDVEDSIGLAKITATRISDKSFNSNFANSIKETFSQRVVQPQQKPKQIPIRKMPNIDKVKSKLKSLYNQKAKLTYNPYRVKKSMSVVQQQGAEFQQSKSSNKKGSHDRKQKNYFLQSMHQTYNEEIKSLAIVYYNMEVVLLRIGKDYNKLCFQEMDTIRIHRERDHKKNQIIEKISLYYHSIIGKWMLLLLIRVEYKSQSKTHSESYLIGYELTEYENKRKGGFNYAFRANQKPLNNGSGTSFSSQNKKQTFSLRIDNFQAISMQIQPKYGIHLISYNGKYVTYRQQYKESEVVSTQSQYWKFSYQQNFKDNNFSLSCLAINPSSSKIIFGTAKGIVIIYDIFSHNFKLKKISSSNGLSSSSFSSNSKSKSQSIIKVLIKNNQGFILTADQKLVVMDLNKFQQVDSFSVRNDQKLHQKVKGFQIFKDNIMTYGSQLKLYDQQVDQVQLHKKRMMENMYTWRLNKLKKTTTKNQQHSNTVLRNPLKKQTKSSQLVISSQSYFIILSQILEIIVINKITLNIKFSFILGIPHDSKVMKMTLSPNEKLISILLLNQNIYIFNIYTQDQYAHIKPSNNHKFVTLAFLDQKNQYLLAAGTENGKIALIPYQSVPQKPIKDLNYHQNSVTTLEVKKDFMITSGEGGTKIGIWQLPFNAIKHEIKLASTQNFITRCIGFYLNRSIYFKTIKNDILQLSLTQFKINQIRLPKKYSLYKVDSLTNKIVAISPTSMHHPNQCTLTILQREKSTPQNTAVKIPLSQNKEDAQNFEYKYKQSFSLNLNLQSEVMEIGIIGSEKAILFCEGGGAYTFSFQSQKLGKLITF